MFESILILFAILVIVGLVWKFSGNRNGIEDDGSGPVEKGESKLGHSAENSNFDDDVECVEIRSINPIERAIVSNYGFIHIFQTVMDKCDNDGLDHSTIHSFNRYLDELISKRDVDDYYLLSEFCDHYSRYLKNNMGVSSDGDLVFDVYREVSVKLNYLKRVLEIEKIGMNRHKGDLPMNFLCDFYNGNIRSRSIVEFIEKLPSIYFRTECDSLYTLMYLDELASKGHLNLILTMNDSVLTDDPGPLIEKFIKVIRESIATYGLTRNCKNGDELLEAFLSPLMSRYDRDKFQAIRRRTVGIKCKTLTEKSISTLIKYIGSLDFEIGLNKPHLDVPEKILREFRDVLRDRLEYLNEKYPDNLSIEEVKNVIDRVIGKNIRNIEEDKFVDYVARNMDDMDLSLGEKHLFFTELKESLRRDDYEKFVDFCSYSESMESLSEDERLLLDNYVGLRKLFLSKKFKEFHLWDIGIFADSVKEKYKGKHIKVSDIESLFDLLPKRRLLPTHDVIMDISCESTFSYSKNLEAKFNYDHVYNETSVKLQYLILKMQQVDESIYGPVVKPQLVSDYERAIFMIDPFMAENWTQEQCSEVLGYLNYNIIDMIDEYPNFNKCHHTLMRLQANQNIDKLMRMVIPRW